MQAARAGPSLWDRLLCVSAVTSCSPAVGRLAVWPEASPSCSRIWSNAAWAPSRPGWRFPTTRQSSGAATASTTRQVVWCILYMWWFHFMVDSCCFVFVYSPWFILHLTLHWIRPFIPVFMLLMFVFIDPDFTHVWFTFPFNRCWFVARDKSGTFSKSLELFSTF